MRVNTTIYSQVVEADEMICEAEPATELPLAQRNYVY